MRQVWKHGDGQPCFKVKTYKPFGVPIVDVSGNEKFRHAGEILDAPTGLYYQYARYMDPELGRFVSLDPELGRLSFPQTLNRYVYCANNPLKFVDPAGMRFYWEPADRRHPATEAEKQELDQIMFWMGFVPGLETVSDAWFAYRAYERGDYVDMGLNIGFLVVPGVGGSYYRGAKAGLKYADDLASGGKKLDVPTPKGAATQIKLTGLMDEFDQVKYAKPGKSWSIGVSPPEGVVVFKFSPSWTKGPTGYFRSSLPIREAWLPFGSGNPGNLLAHELIRPGQSYLYRVQPSGVVEYIVAPEKCMRMLSFTI